MKTILINNFLTTQIHISNLFWNFKHPPPNRYRRASLRIKRARNYFNVTKNFIRNYFFNYGDFRFWHQGASLKRYLDAT